MKFVIKRQHLIKNIQYVVNAISSRTVIPILTGMKIEAKKTGIILTGSNSDISIQSHIPVQIDDEEIVSDIIEGSIVLPVPHFPGIIRKLPEEIVEITVDDSLITTIQSGKANFTLNGQSSSEYPNLPLFQTEEDFKLPKSKL